MDTGRVRFLAVFVVLLCVFAAHNSEGNRKLAQSFSDNGDSWDDMNIDDDTAKQIWTYCSNELKDSTEVVKELNSDLTQSTLNSYDGIEEFDSSLPVKKVIKKAIADLPPKKKEAILDCLREKTLASQILRVEEGTWLDKYQNIVSGWVNVPRRFLRRKRRHHRHHLVSRTAPAPNRAPGPGIGPRPVPGTAPALAPALFVASSVSLITTHLVSAPSPSPVLQPAPYPVPQPSTEAPEPSTPPQDYLNAPSPSDNNGPSILREPFSDSPMENSDTNKIYMIAAIVAVVVAGIAIAALLLLLCRKRNGSKVEPKDGLRDEKPLLNFSASDISAGSSQKTQGIGNASIKAPSTITENDSMKAESQKSKSDTESSDKTNNSNLPFPPGRTTPPSPPPGPPPPPPPLPKPAAPAPPPSPIVSRPPPPNPPRPSTLGPHHRGRSSMGEPIQASDESEAPKTKLKPFFWDKVLASPNHSMVWHEIKAGSFQVDEKMMENLFGYAQPDKNKNGHNKDSSAFEAPRLIQIIDPKKSQNLAILLRALNVTTEEVCDALREGNELPAELIHTLIKMAPTSEEELKLRLYSGDVSHLGPAERFLKVMVEIPFAFKRLESLLFISTYQEEVFSIKESHSTLEVACKELRNSRLFLKLLEAVLKTGNRMNDGTYRGGAQAFKIETLLKLSDVKGTDGKTTLLHFVVQEIIRSEGLRAARRLRESQSMSSVKTEDLIDDSTNDSEEYHRTLGLQVVAGLSNELENVKKAASIDHEILTASVSKLGQSLISTKGFLEKEMKVVEGENDFRDALASFVEHAECDIKTLIEEEKRIMALVKSTGDYFHGRAGKDESSSLFVIIRDFLLMLDKSCKDVKNSTKLLPAKTPKKETLTASSSQDSHDESSLPDYRQRLFPAIRERHVDDDFSSDDES